MLTELKMITNEPPHFFEIDSKLPIKRPKEENMHQLIEKEA